MSDPIPNACPQPETLSNFLLGKLDPQSSQQCEHHLAQCEPCIETINGLNLNDTFQSLVANAGVGEPEASATGDESVVSNLIHRMAGLRTRAGETDINQRAADVIALLSPSQAADSIGKIEHYCIEKVLGVGSSGVVFGAIDNNLDRPVAIKVLRPTLGEAAKQRFIAEARATANLNHSNIVTIFQVGETSSLAYIVMQWLPGETLEQKLDREHVLPPALTRSFAVQIARGLTTAHEKGLVHRDIKPANLWVTEDDHVKILDFGLVRIMDESPQLTCTGMIAGTPCYMSPEQSRGDELDARSDLFSLGCVLYRCLTGKLPFVSSNALATLQAIQRVSPESPRTLEPAVDEDLSDLAMMLLEKSPHRRPDSAKDTAQALESPRETWPFDCSAYESVDQVATNVDLRAVKTIGSPRRASSIWKPAIAGLALAAFGLAVSFFWPQIIRIATNQGEIVIESNDPDVQIEVLSGGEKIEIVDLKTKQRLEVQSGNYQIRAMGEENSIVIDKENLTLSRGETEIVRVTKTQQSQSPGAPDNAKALQTTTTTFDTPDDFAASQPVAKVRSTESTNLVDPAHVVGPGDVLCVFVEEVTGQLDDLMKGDRDYVGMPTPVRSDGTISLPAIEPIKVQGMTIIEIEDAIRKRYVGPILNAGRRTHISVAVQKVYKDSGTTRLKEPVYDGMTYDQCLDAIKYERDGEKLNKPCVGMMALRSAKDSTEVIPLLLEAVLRTQKVNTRRNSCGTFVQWISDEQLGEMALEFTKSESAGRWRMFENEIVGRWDRVRGIEDELTANLIDAMEKEGMGHLSAARSTVELLERKSSSESNEAKLIESLVKYSETSPYNYTMFRALTSFAPEWEGLGKAMSESISESDADHIKGWAMMVRELGSQNQEEAIEALATRVFQIGNVNDCGVLASLPGSLLEKIRPIYESYLAKESDAAIFLQRYMKKKNETEEKIRLMEHGR